MPRAVLLRRSPLSGAQTALILNSYASRLSPIEAATTAEISLNTTRRYYRLIRNRLVETGYYTETPRSIDDQGLASETVAALKSRRGVRGEGIPSHAAEIIEWSAEFTPQLALKHIRKIIALTGPLDVPYELSEADFRKLQAYVRYAQTELIYDRMKSQAETDHSQAPFLARIESALNAAWRAYRAASKRMERVAHRNRS